MSHFSVAVRLSAALDPSDIEDAVRKLLIPYKEAGCGDRDPPELEALLEFEDHEEEWLDEWNGTKTAPCFVDRDGKPHVKYRERFRQRNADPFKNADYVCPRGWTERDVLLREVYPTFEDCAREWHGHKERDPRSGRYGSWRNPNQKWDWYQIGGRWSHKVRIRSGTTGGQGERSWANKNESPKENSADYCRISDIDLGALRAEQVAAQNKFAEEYAALALSDAPGDSWTGPRARALDLGLIECKDETELTGAEWKTQKWGRQNTPGVNRYDVLKPLTRAFLDEHADAFFPLTTFARLDEASGWVERGEMGWFGMSTDTPDSNRAYHAGFLPWLLGGDQGDWLVIVDCHI